MLKLFTRITAIGAKEHLALSFREMKADLKQNIRVVPPLLRKEVFQQQVTHGDYIHGYMVNAGFAEDVKKWHQDHLKPKWRNLRKFDHFFNSGINHGNHAAAGLYSFHLKLKQIYWCPIL